MAFPFVILRRARLTDSHRLWEWRNEPGMRRACFNPDPIPLDIHEAWLARTLGDPARWLFVAELADGTPLGYVRFDEVGPTAEISVCVDPTLRGGGYGPSLIRAGVEALLMERPDLQPVAFVKVDNPASARAFASAGFVPAREVEIQGHKATDMRPLRRSATT